MVFMCRPNPVPNYLKYSSIWHQTKTIRCGIVFCMWENWSQSKRTFKLYALFILAPKFLDLSFFWKFKTSSPPTPYYSSSLYILGIYALRVTRISARGRAFKWFAASAERKCIFEVEKSMNPEVLACFSWFSHFLNFRWFSDGLTVNFNFLAGFPARGWSQIARALNFHLKWKFH